MDIEQILKFFVRIYILRKKEVTFYVGFKLTNNSPWRMGTINTLRDP